MELKIGEFNTLKVKRMSSGGCYLDGGSQEIYLPKLDTPAGAKPGDEVKAFVYNDKRESLKATLRTPHATVGEFCAMTVKDKASFGLFLDWGIEKDLFVPERYLRSPLEPGQLAVVRVLLDFEGTGVVGSCRIDDFLVPAAGEEYPMNREVRCLVYGFSPLGARCVVDNRHSGMLYRSELKEHLSIGDERRGYIKKCREDGLLDLALLPQGFKQANQEAREILLNALIDNDGFLPLTDKSSPAAIAEHLPLSKKLFKKACGSLYKERRIDLTREGLVLKAGKDPA